MVDPSANLFSVAGDNDRHAVGRKILPSTFIMSKIQLSAAAWFEEQEK